jgi:hypothetical protein
MHFALKHNGSHSHSTVLLLLLLLLLPLPPTSILPFPPGPLDRTP